VQWKGKAPELLIESVHAAFEHFVSAFPREPLLDFVLGAR
jgi:hypothetical protein